MIRAIAISLVVAFFAVVEAASIPRTVIALYQSVDSPDVRDTPAHQFAEMPLNHLGYRLEYYDISEGLPDLSQRRDVAAVLSWLNRGAQIKNMREYLKWASDAIDNGIRYIIMGSPGFYPDYPYDTDLPLSSINAFWRKLGLYDEGDLVGNTYASHTISYMKQLVNFERPYTDSGILPAFRNIRSISKEAKVALAAKLFKEEDIVLIAFSPKGAYAAEDYEMLWDGASGESFRNWYINPFLFFHIALGNVDFPRPDTTTMAGRRIYYGHIDGDGWISRSAIAEYRKDSLLCADVIYKAVLEPAADLPCSVGPIAADMDDQWAGFPEARDVARKIFALPNVEIAVHTYSHPFDWGFFKHYTKAKEFPFLPYYPFGAWTGNSLWSTVRRHWLSLFGRNANGFVTYPMETTLAEGYDLPRAYANFPFDVELEVEGSIKRITELAPAGKAPMVYLWSGDCAPFAAAIEHTRRCGIRNLNGGNSRFDTEYPSYAWIRPIGRQTGGQQQIYASAANENIYTDNWLGRYYDYNKLPQTFRNTDTPWRIKPINLYYHMFSGEKLPSLQAVLSNIRYIRTQDIVPITTSHFADIADGFYQVEIVALESGRWAVEHRGALQTVRIDRATLQSVDFSRSEGVLGQKHLQGSLYVFLEPDVERPIVALKECLDCTQEPVEELIYLLSSRWPISHIERRTKDQISFETSGFGQGNMTFRVPTDGSYRVTISKKGQSAHAMEVKADHQILSFVAGELSTYQPVQVNIERGP